MKIPDKFESFYRTINFLKKTNNLYLMTYIKFIWFYLNKKYERTHNEGKK